jgi:hypothetical protein
MKLFSGDMESSAPIGMIPSLMCARSIAISRSSCPSIAVRGQGGIYSAASVNTNSNCRGMPGS